MACRVSTRFYDLLRQLREAHDSEIGQWKLENQSLREGVHQQDQENGLANPCVVDLDTGLAQSSRSTASRSSALACHRRDSGLSSSVVILESVSEISGKVYADERDERDFEEANTQEQSVSENPFAFRQSRSSDDESYVSGNSSFRSQLRQRVNTSFQMRRHWEQLPESAALAWEHGIDAEEIEENTRNALKAMAAKHHSGTTLTSNHFPSRRSLMAVEPVRRCGSRIPVVDPSGTRRMAWDAAGGILIFWDLITIPLQAFDPAENFITDFMSWSCLIFWTFDMVASTSTGVFIDGCLVMDRRVILKRYLKTWFVVDCVATLPEWTLRVLQDSADKWGKFGRLMRTARAMRVLRLLRLVKLKKLLTDVYDLISNEYMFIVVDLIKLLTMILMLNHFVACCWYGVGYLSKEADAPHNWLEDIGLQPVIGGDLAWKYITSLHWSITQFTPAAMDIFATNTPERIYSVVIIFWGLVGLSSFVGTVTASISALRNMSNDHQKQFWMLRKYMRQCRISHALTQKILRYLEHRAQTKKNKVPSGKVFLLSQLSEQLAAQLVKETNMYLLEVHSFFNVLHLQMFSYMDHICKRALKSMEFAQEDVVFRHAQEAAGMFFIKSGGFLYSQEIECERGEFLSEAVLWTPWWHRGDLTAVDDMNEAVLIMHGPFGEVMCEHPKPWNFAQSYGEEFVNNLNSSNVSELTDITTFTVHRARGSFAQT